MERWEEEVWKRVRQGQEVPQRLDLRALELAEGENLGAYQRMLPSMKGTARQTVLALLGTTRENLGMLRGMQMLAGAKIGETKPQPPKSQGAEALLRECYHRTRKLQMEYTARSTEGEWGSVFQILTKAAGESCGQIALALGQLGQRG